MKDTRNFDRAPLKDIRVKDNQVGIRTPQVLIKREGGEYMKGDILDANATTELAKSIHIPDIENINNKLEHTVNKDQIGQPNGVAGLDSTGNVPIDQLANISTDLFIVVSELPTEDIKEGKIYCIKDTSSTAQDNGYIEYAYINNKWEKVGEFKAEPDLSGYAKLTGAVFENYIYVNGSFDADYVSIKYLTYNGHDKYLELLTEIPEDISPTKTYTTDGNLAEIGQEESFIFTLEDGSKVTKSIRVVSTTNSQAGA